jgi:hypothetical protein
LLMERLLYASMSNEYAVVKAKTMEKHTIKSWDQFSYDMLNPVVL